MSAYGGFSKAQRKLLTALYARISGERVVPIATARRVDGKGRQTAANLNAKGYVDHDTFYRLRVWLTLAGVDFMRSLDFRQVGCRR